jgi:hypothetical protein
VRAGRHKNEGKTVGEDPHPKAELRRQLAVAAEWQGGSCDGDRRGVNGGGGWGFEGEEAAAAGYAEPRARAVL